MFQLFMVLLSECFLAFQDYWQINDIRNWVDWLAFKGGFWNRESYKRALVWVFVFTNSFSNTR